MKTKAMWWGLGLLGLFVCVFSLGAVDIGTQLDQTEAQLREAERSFEQMDRSLDRMERDVDETERRLHVAEERVRDSQTANPPSIQPVGPVRPDLADAPSHMVRGWLVWQDHRVAILESDLLWAARMLAGSQTASAREAGNSPTGFSIGAWCRLRAAGNRHLALEEVWRRQGRSRRFDSFSDSFREYSTATSSRWAPNGPACGPGGSFVGQPMCDPRRLARRAGVRGLTWERIADRFGDLHGALQTWARGDHEVLAFQAVASLHTDESGHGSSAWDIITHATHTDQRAREVGSRSMTCGSNRYWETPRTPPPEWHLAPP